MKQITASTIQGISILNPAPSRATDLLEVAAVAGAMTLGAWARVYLPFSPVPVTLQTLVVLYAGFAVRPSRAAWGMLLYMACGTVGLPVLAAPFGPTFGYLLAFVAVPWIAGRTRIPAVGMIAGTLVIYGCGAAWLALWLKCSPGHAVAAGVLPFLPGDAFKLLIAAKLAERYRRPSPHQ